MANCLQAWARQFIGDEPVVRGPPARGLLRNLGEARATTSAARIFRSFRSCGNGSMSRLFAWPTTYPPFEIPRNILKGRRFARQ